MHKISLSYCEFIWIEKINDNVLHLTFIVEEERKDIFVDRQWLINAVEECYKNHNNDCECHSLFFEHKTKMNDPNSEYEKYIDIRNGNDEDDETSDTQLKLTYDNGEKHEIELWFQYPTLEILLDFIKV